MAGAADRSFETTVWQMPPEGWKTYKDSAVKAVAPGAEATAGSHVVEESLRVDGSGKPVRTWKRRDFDKVAGTSAWKEIRSFAGGGSTVASGKRLAVGGGSYVTRSGRGLKASGWYDAEAASG